MSATMNTYENRIRMILLLLIISYKIQRTCGAEEERSFLDDPEITRTILKFLETLPAGQIRSLAKTGKVSKDVNRTPPRDHVSWWNSLNTAIDDFVREFERQHQGSKIRVDRRLKTVYWPLTSNFDDGYTGRYLLNYSFQTGDQVDEVHSSVIISMPDLSFLYDMGKEMMLYDKEKLMFEKVLPLMYRSWKYEKHSPNFYASAESGMLIIENLNDGSRVVKTVLIDSVEECKVVLKALAEFHALSVTQLDEIVYFTLSALTPVEKMVNNTVQGYRALQAVTDYTEITSRLLPPSRQDLIRKAMRNLETSMKSTFTSGRSAVDSFVVLLQGNSQRKNIIFEVDEQTSRITRCKFFHFRYSRLGSPVLDLMTYLMSSVEFQVFAEEGYSLFEFYLEELHKSLAEFNHSREYNLTMLKADLRRHREYFIYMLVMSIPLLWVSDKVSLAKTDEMIPALLEMIQSEKYTLMFRYWMNILSSW